MTAVTVATLFNPADAHLVPGHPLRYGDAVLNPAIGAPPRLDRKRPLVLCLVLGRGPADADAPHATIELWHEGRPVSRTAVALSSRGDEWLQYVAELPLALSPPVSGALELRARLVRGGHEKVLNVPFVLD